MFFWGFSSKTADLFDENLHLILGDGAVTVGVEHLESLLESFLGEIIGKFTTVGQDSQHEVFGFGFVESTRAVLVKVGPERVDGLLDHLLNFRHASRFIG